MKQSKRILAYSALALVVMLAAFGAIAFDTSNVAYAQGTVPTAPTLTAQATGADTINLTWNDVDDAARYELWAWDSVDRMATTRRSHPDWHQPPSYRSYQRHHLLLSDPRCQQRRCRRRLVRPR